MRYLIGLLFLFILILPFSARAQVSCIGSFCSDPYSGVENDMQQLETQTTLQGLEQQQANQSEQTLLESQYGVSAYNSCMFNVCAHSDAGNPYDVETCQSQATSCLAESVRTCQSGYQMVNGACTAPQAQGPTFVFPAVPTGPSATTTQISSGLTSAQVNAILGLLQAFGADASVVANVKTTLGQ